MRRAGFNRLNRLPHAADLASLAQGYAGFGVHRNRHIAMLKGTSGFNTRLAGQFRPDKFLIAEKQKPRIRTLRQRFFDPVQDYVRAMVTAHDIDRDNGVRHIPLTKCLN